MENKLIEFLKTLEDSAVPPASCHHSITYVKYGDDAGGWEDKLALGVWYREGTRLVFLEPGDLAKPAYQLVEEVLQICQEAT